jgi:hypothetical protein
MSVWTSFRTENVNRTSVTQPNGQLLQVVVVAAANLAKSEGANRKAAKVSSFEENAM